MADRYLLETSAVDGYLLEDGSGVLLLESGISLRETGGWGDGTTSVSRNVPTGTTTGDIMLLFVGCKPFDATIVTPSGWTKLDAGSGTNGTTASGVDTGSVQWATFYREWQSGDTTTTVTITGGNVGLCTTQSFKNAGANPWAIPVAAKGSDTSSDTTFSLAMDADPSITANDMLMHYAVVAGDGLTIFTPTLTATSATIGTVTDNGGGFTALGDDLGGSCSYALCTAGSATAAPVCGWTLSVAQTGGGSIVRLREVIVAGAPILNLLNMAPYLTADTRS